MLSIWEVNEMYYDQLNTQEQALVESRISNESRSLLVVYLLLFFAGGLGLHNFYVKRGFSLAGLGQIILTVLGSLTLFIYIGFIFFLILGIWLLIDALRMPGVVRRDNDLMREELALQIANNHQL